MALTLKSAIFAYSATVPENNAHSCVFLNSGLMSYILPPVVGDNHDKTLGTSTICNPADLFAFTEYLRQVPGSGFVYSPLAHFQTPRITKDSLFLIIISGRK